MEFLTSIEFIAISIGILFIIVFVMFFSKMSLKKKALSLMVIILLYSLLCVSFLPKKLTVNDEESTYIALKSGYLELEDVAEKKHFIDIIKDIEFYKGDKHYDFVIQDLTTIHVVSENMSLSGKKVKTAYFFMLKGHKYGMVYMDEKPYYFLQKELYDEVYHY